MSIAFVVALITTLTDLGFVDSDEAGDENTFLFRGGESLYAAYDERYEVVVRSDSYDIVATFEEDAGGGEVGKSALTVNITSAEPDQLEDLLDGISTLWGNVL